MGLIGQIGLIYFTVSGGPYGLEPLIGHLGPFWALTLITVTPLFWAIPISLVVAELSSLLPVAGGYYAWVKKGLGPFWGFQEGWWILCYTVADMALYPLLFIGYLSFFFPELQDPSLGSWLTRMLACGVFIGGALVLNLRGARAVSFNAVGTLGLVLVPFLVFCVSAFIYGDWRSLITTLELSSNRPLPPEAFAAGLATVIWNYNGWDNVATYLPELENPKRVFPEALRITMALVLCSYLLPVLAGLLISSSPQDWPQGLGWPHLASLGPVPYLGPILATVGMFSIWSLFNGQILYISRLPLAMGQDGWLPQWFVHVSPKTGAPDRILWSLAALALVLCTMNLSELFVLDVLFYSFALMLEYLALHRLRRQIPGDQDTFRAPFQTWQLPLLSLIPLTVAGVLVFKSLQVHEVDLRSIVFLVTGLSAGAGIYFTRRSIFLASGKN